MTRLGLFLKKAKHWEYWPIWLGSAPVVLFWLWFAMRARKLFFFSAVNPVIETGGVFGESKYGILQRIPKQHIPLTTFIPAGTPSSQIIEQIYENGQAFPLIAKPNIGERGFLIEKLHSEADLHAYFSSTKPDILIQEFIDYPEEVALLHYRIPGSPEGKITSLCVKVPLRVLGDGQSTVRELMQKDLRSQLQLPRFERSFPDLLNRLPAAGELLLLEPIGNHSRGTTFLDGSTWISPAMLQTFDQILEQMPGVQYGRFDMKCQSLEALQEGKGFKILEYNGVAGEPAHVYDPSIPILEKYRIFFQHWKIIFTIYREQRQKGIQAMTFREVRSHWRRYRSYMQQFNS